MEELLSLARDNNAMLKRVCAYIDRIESGAYRDAEDFRAFIINCAADRFGMMFGGAQIK